MKSVLMKSLFGIVIVLNVTFSLVWFLWVWPDDDTLAIVFLLPLSIAAGGLGALLGKLFGGDIDYSFTPEKNRISRGGLIGAVILTILWWLWIFLRRIVR